MPPIPTDLVPLLPMDDHIFELSSESRIRDLGLEFLNDPHQDATPYIVGINSAAMWLTQAELKAEWEKTKQMVDAIKEIQWWVDEAGVLWVSEQDFMSLPELSGMDPGNDGEEPTGQLIPIYNRQKLWSLNSGCFYHS